MAPVVSTTGCPNEETEAKLSWMGFSKRSVNGNPGPQCISASVSHLETILLSQSRMWSSSPSQFAVENRFRPSWWPTLLGAAFVTDIVSDLDRVLKKIRRENLDRIVVLKHGLLKNKSSLFFSFLFLPYQVRWKVTDTKILVFFLCIEENVHPNHVIVSFTFVF